MTEREREREREKDQRRKTCVTVKECVRVRTNKSEDECKKCVSMTQRVKEVSKSGREREKKNSV